MSLINCQIAGLIQMKAQGSAFSYANAQESQNEGLFLCFICETDFMRSFAYGFPVASCRNAGETAAETACSW